MAALQILRSGPRRTALRLPIRGTAMVSLRASAALANQQVRFLSSKDNDDSVQHAMKAGFEAANAAEESEDLPDAAEFDRQWAAGVHDNVEAEFLREAVSQGRVFNEDEFDLNLAAYDAPQEYFRSLGLDMNNPPQLKDEHYSMLLHGIRDNTEASFEEEVEQEQSEVVDTEALVQDIRRMMNELHRDEQQLTPKDIEYLEKVNWISQAGWDSFTEQGIPIKPEEFKDLSSLDFDFPDPLQQRRPRAKAGCLFCKPDPSESRLTELVYTNVNLLRRFVNDRGMITSPRWNHCCAKHQRKLSQCVKQARYIGLMDWQSNWQVPVEFLQYREADPNIRENIIQQNEDNAVFFKDVGDDGSDFIHVQKQSQPRSSVSRRRRRA